MKRDLAADSLKSGDPGDGWKGKLGRTFSESTPWWRAPVKAPDGAPNIVVILLDDLGFSECGCYGSEIETPNIDRLAGNGVRFNNYTTVPMCTPARAAILTGKNPHSVGVGWLTHNNPGYPGFQAGEISKDAPTIPELLRDNGYSTYATGKWHNTADYHTTAGADRSSWPLQRGFDRFYGFLGAETNYHSPGQIVEGNEFVSIDDYGPGYFSTDDFTGRAVSWVKSHRSANPEKPFFLYFAPNAPHTPHHAKTKDIIKYKGRYDSGWDSLRQERFKRQKQLGVVGADWELPGLTPGVPAWKDVPEEKHELLAAYMEIYAGLVDNLDQNIGRLVETLEQLGIFNDTLFLITSDNGATSIGGIEGAGNIAEKRLSQFENPDLPQRMLENGRLGAVDSSPAYPNGWGNAGNTPFRFFKRTPMNGGIRVPFIAHWKDRFAEPGGVLSEWVHVTDVLPTILDTVGISYPTDFKGYRTRELDGVSFKGLLFDKGAKSNRKEQYYELEGNRGYISGKWKAVSLQPPGAKIDMDNWLLFDLEKDPTEIRNLAKDKPDILKELVEQFDLDAFKNYAYPLDNRTLIKVMTNDPYRREQINRTYMFYHGSEAAQAMPVSALVSDRDYELTCAFIYEKGQEGVLFALGDALRGFCAFVLNEELVFHYNGGFLIKRDLRLPILPGDQVLRVSHQATGNLNGQAIISLDSAGSSRPETGELDMSPSIVRLTGEGFEIGL
ncbi:MAG: arylsulfatase, partial [Deltaproteobacteria bacterium]|nr:arylsulfatase [Deltaproteobacteria bacterium]